MSQIFLHYIGHSHAQCGGEVLHRHRILFLRIFQKAKQAVGQSFRSSWWVELDRQFFTLSHLSEIQKISADNRNTESACQVRDATATSGR
jgi:hypothetical protein